MAHIHAFEYFNGVAEVLVPDNLKTGVNKALRGEPILNEAYRDLANYYGDNSKHFSAKLKEFGITFSIN